MKRLREFSRLLSDNKNLFGTIAALLAIPNLFFWGYVQSFGPVAVTLADGTLYFHFITNLSAYIFISIALGAIVYAVITFLTSFIPLSILKRSSARRWARYIRNSPVPRFAPTGYIFLQLYLPDPLNKAFILVIFLSVVYIIIRDKFTRRKTQRILAALYDVLTDKNETKLKGFSDGDSGAHDALTHEVRQISKSIDRRKRRSSWEFNYGKLALLSALAFISFLLGSFRAGEVKSSEPLRATAPFNGQVVVAGITGSHFIFFHPMDKSTTAYPRNEVRLRREPNP